MDRVRKVEIREELKHEGGTRESAKETSEMERTLDRDGTRETSQESVRK